MKALHNIATVDLKDATTSQILKSINWYRKTIPRLETDSYAKVLLAQCKEKLAYCEAEYADRIGN